jgi:hypothetical protein
MTPAQIQCCGLSRSMRTTNRISKIWYPVFRFSRVMPWVRDWSDASLIWIWPEPLVALRWPRVRRALGTRMDSRRHSHPRPQAQARAALTVALGQAVDQPRTQSRSQSMPVRGLGCGMPQPNPRTGILWERDCLVLAVDLRRNSDAEAWSKIRYYKDVTLDVFP